MIEKLKWDENDHHRVPRELIGMLIFDYVIKHYADRAHILKVMVLMLYGYIPI